MKLSEKFLKQSGAGIELARTRIVMRDYYLAQGRQKLAISCMEKTWAFLFKSSENLFPNDLLDNIPRERKIELIIDKITSINKSMGTVRNQPALLEMVMNAAMDFTNAMQSCLFIHEEGNLKLIASRKKFVVKVMQRRPRLTRIRTIRTRSSILSTAV